MLRARSLPVFAVFAWCCGMPSPVHAQQVHRNGFEALKPAWVKSGFDAAFDEIKHHMVDQGAHDGQRCEFLQLNAKPGNFIHYQYSLGRLALNDETSARVWVKSNRPGLQLMARIILPNERDPNSLDNRLTTFIRGDVYRNAGRWQPLEIGRPLQLSKQQQQLLQAQAKRSINFSDAYIDALVLNVFAGPGPTEVWIDDLECAPLSPDPSIKGAVNAPGPDFTKPSPTPRAVTRNQIVEFSGNQLVVGGKRMFFRGIRHSDTPLRVLKESGFNAVYFENQASQALLKEAAGLGLWMIPQLHVFSEDAQLTSTDGLIKEVNRYAESDAILFWHLGGTLALEQSSLVSRAAQIVRQADPGRPVGADVWDGLAPYSRNLNLVGVHRWPLMTTLELTKYREWLDQRRRLATPGSFLWTWIQTHLPEWHTQLLYERSALASFAQPVGPQPEHIRLLTYLALATGNKGVAFWSDRFLADSHHGRDRLLCCALLNQEIELLEPLLVSVDDAPVWIDTSVPDIKAAVLRTGKGILVLPIWLGKGAQFVPGQAAVSKLSMVVPQVPQSMQAWEVSPADARGLRAERVVGGTKVTVPEFGLTSAVVFTADNNLVIRFQDQARARRQLAAQWSYDMGLYELEKVLQVHEALEKQGHTVPDAGHLIQDTRNRLQAAKELWDSHLFAQAYHEAQRALRPLRILMRAQWEQAVKELDSPVSCPHAVTFFSLPRHWQFMDQVRASSAAANVLPGGDFEAVAQKPQDIWRMEEPTLDEVDLLAQRVGEIKLPLSIKGGTPTSVESPRQGKQCAMLQIKPKKGAAPQALERTLLALTSPTIKLQPGSLVQVSGWVRIPEAITASPDGALFYDSAGGEPMAVRLTEPTPWKKFTLYRRVPSTGTMHVTLALTGIGTVYFDDVRIEPLVTAVGGVTPVSGFRK
ncbi:MAG: hypothetical protein L0Y72_20210 [Gemmataceae bacterium]|nr:hypothetical protein [Gemmataceae bacterium]MCI0741362.1 hypothetical protein [Gemmataceae bacterium]